MCSGEDYAKTFTAYGDRVRELLRLSIRTSADTFLRRDEKEGLCGAVLLSARVYELPDMVKAAATRKVVSFDEFTDDNDPHGEHDFGKFELFFWKKLLR